MNQTTLLLVLLLLPSLALSEQTIGDNVPDHWPDARYEVHNNGTVTDTDTSLMWMQCSLGQTHKYDQNTDTNECDGTASATYTWQTALETAYTYSFANYTDWRLPNIGELGSLVAYNRYDPAINIVIFPNIPSDNNGRYWSASPSSRDDGDSWLTYFKQGINNYYNRVNFKSHVRLVRSTD